MISRIAAIAQRIGRTGTVLLAAAGATAGILIANAPAAMLGGAFAETVPVKPIRYAIAALLLVTGFVVAVQALELA